MSLALFRWSVILTCLFTTVAFAGESRPRRQKVKAAKLVRVEGGHRLHRDTATALERMATEATKDGLVLRVTSGYRSLREQRWLYEEYRRGRGNKAARPGRSNHQRGLAVDLVIGQRTSKRYLWLEANACRFGFRRTVPSEPWHWEYRPSSTFPPVVGFDCLGNPTRPPVSPEPVARKDPS
ncbi:D-alanyl-D-alanine carboxypeptidase family protein [Myxococcus sp. CA051A]|uniref:M15 family metallopeptidase n=1 Tax=unclassified Myxococcus TaxID=2648731 RepID=UPI00157A9D8A|nr:MULTISPECIES: M15 family metallopeptidase [unclassified Myxococcus]NTX08229.1 D-alanyl-D-alanine carboxypeptidase family protein [Myxococcus sp. CA040A]NTX38920.1 D-alanyl-D-alanine carboxypeptidase family protein [Myxococcus sp. CA033]NTX55460.1 D-alanyl-D-alanine carboxypeptidase family protein [Myxococcus sp. CA039A]NTX67657.1 D-alanyl-D-alanine carboxypeptidase family protein [Myxococcus sp. CA051A]